MKTLVLTALSMLFLAPGAAAPALADGTWNWPLDDYGRDAVGHDYAEYNACLKTCNHRTHLHNTGIDVPAPKGTPVKAVEDGFVVNLIPNDTGCSSDCTDHGYGNTMILQHTGTRFSEYAHMLNFHDKDPLIAQIKAHCAFYDRTDENGVHVSGWECTRGDNIAVKQGDVIGQVGATGLGRNDASPPHLRFEGTTFPTLYSYSCYSDKVCCPKHKCFGYSGIHPFQAAYIDPVNLEETTDGKGKVHVQVGPQGEGIGLRIGPDERYDLQTRWHAADGAYWAIRSAVATKDCDQGWYKIMKAKQFPPMIDQYFDPTDAARFGAGTLPDTWVCIGNGGDQYVVPVL